jgi:pyruvate/2-oxoacid:ferredoxin oxidoreductase alpha subunit
VTTSPVDEEHKSIVTLPQVVIRFAGDSGDGMQLTGDRFTAETAGLGNDLSTPPSDCFAAAIEASRIAVTYRTPVFLLSDRYLANGSQPW